MRLPPYRKASHIVDDLQHHVVWITKPRKPALHGETATRLRKFMRETCGSGVAELLHHTKAVGRGGLRRCLLIFGTPKDQSAAFRGSLEQQSREEHAVRSRSIPAARSVGQ